MDFGTLISCACRGTQIIAVISHPSKYCDLFSHSSPLKYLSAIWLQFICSHLLVSHTSFFFCHRLHKMDSFDILISLPWLGLGAYLGATVFKRPKYNRKTIHVITIVINDCLHHDCHDDDCVRKW